VPNNSPTDLADPNLFYTQDDTSDPGAEIFYRTAEGYPWALDITSRWSYPLEYQDLAQAYPNIGTWISTAGASNQNWHQFPDSNLVWMVIP